MAKFKMKKLALALGMVAGGMSLVPAAQAVNLATDGLGQALVFPYYTVRDGWNTLFNITNTSAEVVAFKIRFHEGRNSRDVFDFNVFLSPYDVWTGWVEYDEAGGARFNTNDNSCTAPPIPSGGQTFEGNGANGTLAYTGTAADGGGTTVDRLREGYVTIIVMGTADDLTVSSTLTPLAANAVHSTTTGLPLNCAALVNAFNNPSYAYHDSAAGVASGINALKAEFPNYVLNPLKGAFSLVKGSEGWNATGSATTLANFYLGEDDPAVSGTILNLVTFQLPPATAPGGFVNSFHEPDLASSNTRGWVLTAGNIDVPGDTLIGSTANSVSNNEGADAVSFVLQRKTIDNQWANRTDPSTGWLTQSDWVVTFPTKRFYVDRATHEFAGHATGRSGLPASAPAPFANNFTLGSAFAGQSCDTVALTIYDREERTTTSGPVFSPAPVASNALCYEVSVLNFDGTNVLSSATGSNVTPLPSGAANGWMNLRFNATQGLPAIGFSAITRATADGSLNEAFLVDHAYTRVLPPSSTSAVTGEQVVPAPAP